jgi:hypothetical protein
VVGFANLAWLSVAAVAASLVLLIASRRFERAEAGDLNRARAASDIAGRGCAPATPAAAPRPHPSGD